MNALIFFCIVLPITILSLIAFVLYSAKQKGASVKELWLDSVKEGEELSSKVDSINETHKNKSLKENISEIRKEIL